MTPQVPSRFFLHFLGHEIRPLFRLSNYFLPETLVHRFTWLGILALSLSSKHVLVPAAAFMQDEVAHAVLLKLWPFAEVGRLKFVGDGLTSLDWKEPKLVQYAPNRERFPRFFIPGSRDVQLLGRAWIGRQGSATKDLSRAWVTAADQGVWSPLADLGVKPSAPVRRVPELLGKDAFIAANAMRFLSDSPGLRSAETMINVFLTRAYIESFTQEYEAAVLTDLCTFDTTSILPSDSIQYCASELEAFYRSMGLDGIMRKLGVGELSFLFESAEWGGFRQTIEAKFKAPGLSAEPDHVWVWRTAALRRKLKRAVKLTRKGGLRGAVMEVLHEWTLKISSVTSRASSGITLNEVICQGKVINIMCGKIKNSTFNNSNIVLGQQFNFMGKSQDDQAKAVAEALLNLLDSEMVDLSAELQSMSSALPPATQLSPQLVGKELAALVEEQPEPKKAGLLDKIRRFAAELGANTFSNLLANIIIEAARILLVGVPPQ